MKIQKINNSNINFRKNEYCTKANTSIKCNIDEYSDGKKRMISFSFEKEALFKTFKNLMSRFGFFTEKENEVDIQININPKEPVTTEKEIESRIKSNPKSSELPFPTPKFTSNPTIKQRDEYVDNLLEFFKSTQDANAKLKALKEIEKYGIADLSCIAENLIGGGNEAIMQETLRIYSKWGSPDDAYQVIEPIVTSEISITQEKTFIEVLKTIQKLAKLENDSVQDREIVLKPIRRLLKHENENVRKMAQETLIKITPKK